MKIIGITGASGSGKTTTSEILNKREDAKIIDADKVAKSLNIPGTDYMNDIRNVFGEKVLLENGHLNRKELAKIIYSDKKARENLNSLTFKYVVDEILKTIEKYKETDINFIIVDAPLLIESGLNKYCDFVIALIADDNLKIKRICKRDNIDKETAIKRLKIQHDNSYYIDNSDFYIENTEDYNLEKRINEILDLVIKK